MVSVTGMRRKSCFKRERGRDLVLLLGLKVERLLARCISVGGRVSISTQH
jgi:hypothetical protein